MSSHEWVQAHLKAGHVLIKGALHIPIFPESEPMRGRSSLVVVPREKKVTSMPRSTISSSTVDAILQGVRRCGTRRLAAAPQDSGSKKVDADTAQKAMDAFAKAVGQPAGMDPEILDVLWDQCLDALGAAPDSSQTPSSQGGQPQAPPTNEIQARAMLTAAQRKVCDSTGCTAVNFLAVKHARTISERKWREPLNPNGSRG